MEPIRVKSDFAHGSVTDNSCGWSLMMLGSGIFQGTEVSFTGLLFILGRHFFFNWYDSR